MRILIGFLAYLVIEVAVAVAVATRIGWLLVFAFFFAGFCGGLWVMKMAGLQAAQALNAASRTGELPGGEVGDAAVLFGGGILIAAPGFVTDFLGLLCVIPPTRRLSRRLLGVLIARRLRRSGVSVVTTTIDGVRVTRVVPGDVIAGEVIREGPAATDQPPPPAGGQSELEQ